MNYSPRQNAWSSWVTPCLFREALQRLEPGSIQVVDFASSEEDVERKRPGLLQAYRNVFQEMTESQFGFSGARRWVFDNLTEWLFDSNGRPIAFIFGMQVISRQGRFVGSMIDSTIVWGEGRDGSSVYKGELEGNRLVFREDGKKDVKYMAVKAPKSPGIPKAVPSPIEPIVLRTGLRDIETSALD